MRFRKSTVAPGILPGETWDEPYCYRPALRAPKRRPLTTVSPPQTFRAIYGAPLQELGQFEIPTNPFDVPVPFQPRPKTSPFECGPCETWDFGVDRCVRSDAPPAEGCPGQQVWDPTVCLCVEPGTQAQKPSETATKGVSAAVVVGTVVLLGGALLLLGRS